MTEVQIWTALTPTLSPRPGRGRTIRSISRLASRVPVECLPSPWPQGEGRVRAVCGRTAVLLLPLPLLLLPLASPLEALFGLLGHLADLRIFVAVGDEAEVVGGFGAAQDGDGVEDLAHLALVAHRALAGEHADRLALTQLDQSAQGGVADGFVGVLQQLEQARDLAGQLALAGGADGLDHQLAPVGLHGALQGLRVAGVQLLPGQVVVQHVAQQAVDQLGVHRARVRAAGRRPAGTGSRRPPGGPR